ncbi:MAG: efflux RND transporter periplasmic adaptor subunit [Patescibacteria group bacterium]
MFQKILNYLIKHKIIIGLIIIMLAVGGYFIVKSLTSAPAATRYVLAAVEKGTIITSVSGTGQISATNQVDVKAKASGDLYNVAIVAGQEVKNGAILAQINAKEALKTVRDAKANLDSAKLSLEKLQKAADQLSVTQAENALAQAKEAKQQAEDDLQKAYDDGFNTVSNVFLQLPDIITGLEDVLFGSELGGSTQWNIDYYANAVPFDEAKIFEYKELALNSAKTARSEFDKNFSDYKTANRFSDISTIETLLDETYNTSKIFAEAIKNTNNFIQFYEDALARHNQNPASAANTQLATLNTYTGQVNTHLQNLLSIINTIQADKTSIVNSERTITEKTQSLAELNAGTDPLDLKAQEYAVQQKQNALADANEKLADYTVRAPFAGVIAAVSVQKGDSISSGGTIATLITKQKTAEISLNEVDVTKIKVGQKATLTFDAIDGLSITGEVAQVDIIGTVSSGVVTYNVKIIFDTQDDRVKSGMSVSASIITETSQDVLEVPSSAIKTSNGVSYVLQLGDKYTDTSSAGIVSADAPTQTQVESGLSDDTYTEIISGLKEGDLIVVKTIKSSAVSSSSATTKTNTNKSSSSSSILGGTGGGPGGMPPQ